MNKSLICRQLHQFEKLAKTVNTITLKLTKFYSLIFKDLAKIEKSWILTIDSSIIDKISMTWWTEITSYKENEYQWTVTLLIIKWSYSKCQMVWQSMVGSHLARNYMSSQNNKSYIFILRHNEKMIHHCRIRSIFMII
jgi:hypothetical protein